MRTTVITTILLLVHLRVNLNVGFVLKNQTESDLSQRAHQMLSFMNESVDPCENFYEFTCGQWSNLHSAKNEKLNVVTHFMRTIADAFDKKVIEVLREKNNIEDAEHDKKVKIYYQSCMSLVDGVDSKRIEKLLEEFGKMPALAKTDKEWDDKNFDWIDTLARIKRRYGYQIIIGLGVEPDMMDNSTNRIYIGEADFELENKSVYLDPIGEDYRDWHKIQMALNLNFLLDVKLERALKVATEILDFEIELAKSMDDLKSDRSLQELLTKTTADELQVKYAPTIDVKRLFQIVFDEVPTGMIYEYKNGYLKNVKEVIEKTEKRIIANYLFYHVLRKFDIRTGLSTEEREKYCLNIVKKEFYAKIDNMFYQRFIDNETVVEIQQIWQKIKETFKAKLLLGSNMNWMTNETRKKALEKLEVLKLHINSYVERDFAKDFANLTLSENDFVGNLQNITELETRKSFSKLHEPVSQWDVGFKISEGAINFQAENSVYLPVFLLQQYFLWAIDYPAALKFSMLGFLLSHELIHAFDDEGHLFGVTGNVEDWWDDVTSERFLVQRNCFAEQYHRYVYGKEFLPKTERQSENIADNGGLKLAYDAFKVTVSHNNEEVELPGFNYTKEQIFFIGFGQMWCNDVRKFFLNYQVAVDVHVPDKYRSIGTVSNSWDFAEAFNCAVGSKMNPRKKCQIY